MSQYNPYHYFPITAPNVVGSTLFALLLISQITLGIIYRQRFFSISWSIGLLMETIGFIARSLSNSSSTNLRTLYIIQSTCTIIAPTFFAAAFYYQLGKLVALFGRKYSIMPAKLYAIIFVVSDWLAIFIQAAGAGLASSSTSTDSNSGTNVIIGGLVVQIVFMTIFLILGATFFFKLYRHDLIFPPYWYKINPYLDVNFSFFPFINSNSNNKYKSNTKSPQYGIPILLNDNEMNERTIETESIRSNTNSYNTNANNNNNNNNNYNNVQSYETTNYMETPLKSFSSPSVIDGNTIKSGNSNASESLYQKQDLYDDPYYSIKKSSFLNFFIVSFCLSIILVYIRCIYRVVEFAQGWDGYIASHEVYFLVLDGLLIFLAILVLTIAYPGFLFGHTKVSLKRKKTST